MGISGLLPALKSIQKTKRLSELSGQTIAIDAYVWLHKAVFSCATELATGKPTIKYVDYVMHRVRLLRHHNITPYLVFDGGPLPAKLGTEEGRKQKRDESLAIAKALEAQGKSSQARDHFVKCVDVSPQMAYQVIKALRAESVPHVVAPYEADAQLAFLERSGIVDAILTEDSDLLVFGCRNVLFKLDTVANTVVSICRDDFGSVAASASDASSISLVGWSDAQFRSMAILSGCDYLPSIQGIGLKTACTLLRKWKTVEQVIRVVKLEGKKSVPKGYMDSFKLAEKCFLHQRVYDPTSEQLVHLTEVDCEWTDELELYVGRDMEPLLAKRIAIGDVDPTTLKDVADINPGYAPHSHNALPLVSRSRPQSYAGKSKEDLTSKAKPTSGGILSFFGPNAIIPQRPKGVKRSGNSSAQGRPSTAMDSSKTSVKAGVIHTAGKASGKRTLAEVMDEDLERKRQRICRSPRKDKNSRFFSSSAPLSAMDLPDARTSSSKAYVASPHPSEKENFFGQDDNTEVSLLVHKSGTVLEDAAMNEVSQTVPQEEGYMSPLSSARATPDLSSPIRHSDDPLEDDVEPVSSPMESRTFNLRTVMTNFSYQPASCPSPIIPAFSNSQKPAVNRLNGGETGLGSQTPQPKISNGVDLRDIFDDGGNADYSDNSGDEESLRMEHSRPESSPPYTPSPQTPADDRSSGMTVKVVDDWDLSDELSDPEEREARLSAKRQTDVANGWRRRFSHVNHLSAQRPHTSDTPPLLARRETNVTPLGRHSLSSVHSIHSACVAEPSSRSRDTLVVRSVLPQQQRSVVKHNPSSRNMNIFPLLAQPHLKRR